MCGLGRGGGSCGRLWRGMSLCGIRGLRSARLRRMRGRGVGRGGVRLRGIRWRSIRWRGVSRCAVGRSILGGRRVHLRGLRWCRLHRLRRCRLHLCRLHLCRLHRLGRGLGAGLAGRAGDGRVLTAGALGGGSMFHVLVIHKQRRSFLQGNGGAYPQMCIYRYYTSFRGVYQPVLTAIS